jgi:hypothetical protein
MRHPSSSKTISRPRYQIVKSKIPDRKLLFRHIGVVYWILVSTTVCLAFWQLYTLCDNRLHITERILTTAYLTARMFVLEDISSVEPAWGTPILLQFLRILGPALFASGVIAWAAKLIAGFDWVRLQSCSKHVIVSGLGDKGLKVALSAREAGLQVVAIEANKQSPESKTAEDRGVIVISSDASNKELLKRVKIHRCSKFFAFCPVCKNAEIISSAIDVLSCKEKKNDLSCKKKKKMSRSSYPILYSHVSSPALRNALQRREYDIYHQDQPWIEYLNILDKCSGILASRFQLSDTTDRILIAGCSEFHECLFEWLARHWASLECSRENKLQITFVAPGSSISKNKVYEKHPHIGDYLNIECFDGSLAMWVRQHQESFSKSELVNELNISIACVSELDDNTTLASALEVEESFRQADSPALIYAVFNSSLGYGRLLDADTKSGDRCIEAFGLLEEFCDIQVLEENKTELLAKAIHDGYLKNQGAQKKSSILPRYKKPWSELSEANREPSRASARMAIQQLGSYRLLTVQATEILREEVVIGSLDIEALAQSEHSRGIIWKADQGYRHGSCRNDKGHPRTPPSMIPFSDLSETEKVEYRNMWLEVFKWLTEHGYLLIRSNAL